MTPSATSSDDSTQSDEIPGGGVAGEGPASSPVADEQADALATAADQAPRDERHDGIDPATGLLTDEAVELRREHGIVQSGLQVEDDG